MLNYNNKTNRFQADYQAPFGGIDTSAFPSAISDKNFAALSQAINNANVLTPIGWQQIISQALASGSGNFLGYIPLAESSYVGYIITTKSVIEIASDGVGGIAYTTYSAGYTPAATTYGHFSYEVIDELIIWTTETWNEIWSFNTNNDTISRLTNYIGGGILGSIDNQLICLGGVSNLDGQVPYRISWSAPGQYGQFQPYDVGSGTGSYAAGFNDLPDTSDVLVGIITIGTVAYLFRSQGITQMTPTGNGIQPFNFNHLWASKLGIGTVFPDSIAQYGSMGAFVSDSGIYSLGLSGLQEITGQAKTTIYALINNIPSLATNTLLPKGIVSAVCVPYLLGTPGIYYVIGIANGLTSAPSGTSPSISQYTIFAIDVNNNNSCYSLGTQAVAPDPTVPASYAVGALSYINRSYSAAPSPVPPTPPSYPDWANTTFYTPFNAWTIYLPNANPGHTGYVEGGLYELTTGGVINTAVGAPPTVNTPALGGTVTVGTATFTYRGPSGWTPNFGYQLDQMCGISFGTSPNIGEIAYQCTKAGTSGTSQVGWSQTPGDTINDGTVEWVCVGPISTLLTADNTPGGATSYAVTPLITILDPSNYLQQNKNTTVNNYNWTHGTGPYTITQYNPMPGGFSQSSAPPWDDTTGGFTNEVKILSGPVPAAIWECLGPKPVAPTSLVGANVAAIVPLFIAVNNNILGGGSSITGSRVDNPGTAYTATLTFRKEQMKFGAQPTVSKVAVIGCLIDSTKNGSINVSVDGGVTFSSFSTIAVTPGSGDAGNGVMQNLYSDGVQTLERPQLVLRLTNMQIAEAWMQGTLADLDLI